MKAMIRRHIRALVDARGVRHAQFVEPVGGMPGGRPSPVLFCALRGWDATRALFAGGWGFSGPITCLWCVIGRLRARQRAVGGGYR